MNQQDDEVRLLRKDSISTDNEIPVPATPRDHSNEYEMRRERRSSDIAIIGMSGRFAGSANLEAFWDHLQKGHSCIEEIQRKGWETGTHSGPDSGHSHTSQVKWGGMLQNIDQFDPLFFNISPLEAAKMDPQQRLFLEEAYKSFEDAGYSAEQLSGKRVGVFVGARSSDYKEQALSRNCAFPPHRRDSALCLSDPVARRDSALCLSAQEDQIDAHLFLGNDMAILAARISYFLNLKGPSLTIDTASSSSLVAIHLACESIHTGESEMALAGGVFVMSSPEYALMAAKTQMLSPDGKCKTFDKSANGIVIGEGVGALVLKPLDAAIEDRDHIYGVILGSAINHDGKTFGMTAPSLLSQEDLLVSLYKKAAIHPETVSYIEAHGTGSKLGDPIEVQALTDAFRLFTDKTQFCAIGSHKPNIGHTISSAGIAGVLKVLLAMKYQQLPPTINVEEINPEIDFQSSPFFLNTELREWKRRDRRDTDRGKPCPYGPCPRRAGVSSFGLSGTNCHLILEEPPPQKKMTDGQARPAFFFPLSAKTRAALTQKVEDMVDWLEKEGEKYAVEDIAYTLVQGRSHFAMRSAVVAKDTNELKEYLRAIHSLGGSEQAEINTKGHGLEPTELLFNEYGAWLLQELREYDTSDQNGYKEKITVLANMYVKGYNLDWSQLFQKGRHFRVPLPTYPFSRESYWLETTPRDQSRHLLDGYAGTLSGLADSGREGGQVQGIASTALQSGEGRDTPSGEACPYPLPLREALSRMVSSLLKVRVEEIDAEIPLSEYGFDSITFTEFANRLNQTYQLNLTPAHFFEYSTLERLAQYLHANYASTLAPYFAAISSVGSSSDISDTSACKGSEETVGARTGASPVPTTSAHGFTLSRLLRASVTTATSITSVTSSTPIAIIGMSGAFPQAPDVQSLWNNLLEGKDCIGEIPASRWNWQAYFGNPETSINRTNIKWAGIVEEVEQFDPLFFGISPREAEQMDPQQRLLMMYVWKAIEAAGYAASSLSGTNTALFVGTASSGYNERFSRANMAIEGYSATGQTPSVGPNRMSYFLNLHGPSEAIETACSSSLIAIHRGVSAIESGQCTLAIVGGVNTLVSPELHIGYSKAGMLSEDGHCKTFSAQANGYVRGEGVGILVLKKLSEAEQAGDHIYGVIRGSAENHGGRASSLTAPNPRAQADLLIAAYRKAGIDPRTVSYIEAHGTGTALGDPIEINGLKTAFSELRTDTRHSPYSEEGGSIPQAWCGIGSVKSNIGHLELAAGVAGVIKVLLQLRYKKLVKSLHCEQLNPYIQLEGSPFHVVQENREWEALRDDEGNALPRRAGVSSFGFGGVNAHIVLEEYIPNLQAPHHIQSPTQPPGWKQAPPLPIVLSARTEERLHEQARQLLAWLQAGMYTEEPLGQGQNGSEARFLRNLAYTLQVGREAMEERLASQVSSLAELEEKLHRYVEGVQEAGDWYRGQVRQHKEAVALLSTDEEFQETIGKWFQRGKYDKLLSWWVKGLRIDWQPLYTVGARTEVVGTGQGQALSLRFRPRRISLPTYPFARERYWIPIGAELSVARGAQAEQGQVLPATDKTNGNRVALRPLADHPQSSMQEPRTLPTPSASTLSIASGHLLAPTLQAPQIEEELVRSLAQALYIEEGNIDVEKPFGEMGLDSVIGVEWIQSLNKQYASNLKASSIYDYPTVRQLASFLQKEQYRSIINVGMRTGASPVPTAPVREMVAHVYRTGTNEAEIRTQTETVGTGLAPVRVPTDSEASSPSGRNEAIAIVGMSGRYPDARNLSEYWENLVQRKNGIREIPLSRFNVSDYYDPSPARSGKIYCKWLGALDEIEYFDPLFFQLSPAEAEGMDPQQRLFLEEGYKAFEDAGYSPRLLSNSKCGVYLGIMSHEYDLLLHQQRASDMSLLGGNSAIAAARIAYHLNLKGPAIAIDTACSSSLVAIHLACQALRCQEIDMALVGGVSLYLTPGSYMGMCSAGMLSADGQCRTFDASANGFVPGEGVGALVLKRLADAEADHDQIYGVIIGSGINQDGATNGITAPSVKSQIELEREIYEKYHIDPESISYVEMHGTGTQLGDPIELEALATVFQERTQRKEYCAIGSVKTNIGHTSAAAGVAGLQKVLLAMKYKKLVPSLHFEQPNPHFDFAASPFYVNTEVQDWKSASGTPLRAAVSAFGFSGTNAHLVLEEYIPASFPSRGVEDGDLDTSPDGGQPYPPLRSPGSRLFVLSAKSEQQLASYAQEMKRWLQAHAELALMDVAFTLQLGREAMEYRLAILADSREILLQRLDQFVNKQASPGLYTAQVKGSLGACPPGDATLFEADEDGQSLLHIWCQKKNLAKIAQVWVRGVNIDWVLLYKGGVGSAQDTIHTAPTLPYRISLPTYPFARERYWIPIEACRDMEGGFRDTDGGKPRPYSPRAQASLWGHTPHPLVQRNTSTLWEQRFNSTFHGDEFFLADHIVKGQRIMPGVAYLEMACAAVREAIGATAEHELRCLRLSHVVWARPLVVGEQPVTVRIALSPQENGTIAFLISRDLACVPCATEGSDPPEEEGTEQVYCQGIAELHSENTVRLSECQSLDLPAVQARCQHQISATECYQRYRELSLNYGPAFQGIEQLSRGEGEVLARFRLPSMVAQTPTEEGRPFPYVLHPSVLDAALQASLGLLIGSHEREVLHLPFALDELSIVGEVPTEGWAWVRRSPGPWACPRGTAGLDGEDLAPLLDIEVCDDAGHIALRLRGLSMRPPGSRFEFLRTVLLVPNWKEQEAPLPTGETGADISLMVPVMPSLAPVTQSLVLLCGLSGILASRIEAKLASGGRCRDLSSEAPRRELRFQDMAWQLMQELQYLLRKRSVGPVFVQVVVARRGEPSLLEALVGVLKTAQQEYPKLAGQLIEIEGEPEESQLLAWLAENQKRPRDAHIRYRNGQRWVREWQEQLDRTPAAKIPWKEGGCYLITGGAGGLARLFVQEIALHVETATIILVGRSALSASQRAQLVPENGGIHIDYQQVDVSDGPAVHALIQRVLAKSGHLDGIIHAAGVLRDSLLLNKTQENVRAVLAPKVIGVEHLDEASRDIPLDFFILCSSFSAVAGNVGQADYAAANAYLDAFAHARVAQVLQGERAGATLSINWPLWKEGGMQIEAETIQIMRERLGIEVMDTQTGMKMLYQALSCGQAQVMVAHGQVERIKQRLRQISVGADRAGLTQQEQQETTLLGQETLRERASTYFKKQLATVIKLPVQQIDIEAPLENYGFNSILAIRFTNSLEDSFGPLSKTLLFEYPTVQSVTEYFLHCYPEQLRSVLRIEEAPDTVIPQVSSGDLWDEYPADPRFAPKGDSNHLHHRLALLRKGVNPFPTNELVCDALARQDKETRVNDIAIIGLAGRYPGARDVRTFWENLRQGRDCLSEIPRERWDHRLYFDADKNKVGTTCSKWGGFLEGVDEFDPLFFNISPQEAERMDPQERLFLECVYATIEDAGYTRQGLSLYQRNGLHGSVGVFVGVMYEEYQLFGAQAQIQGRPIAVAGNPSSIANRVSYFCNFHGPSLAVDTMCSSSLTAIHLACQSIQQGECALAIAGGVNVSIHPNKYLLLGQGQFVSSQGHCESFGVGADGYVPAEGVGAVLLKPRVLAEADGDHIYGVIKATAINHGGKTNGYTVPNPQAQAEVIGQALKDARIDPETISCIEAHGTGTVLGDPIEIAGLVRAFEQGMQNKQWCAIGSVKSNIGHAESAAGIAGVTKVLLQMRYGQLVPSLHSEVLNPHIDFSATPFVVQQELSSWKRLQMPGTSEGKELPRRAGISSFGAGGANAHVILEEYVEREQENNRRKERSSSPALVVLSARTGERLKERVQQLLDWMQEGECAEKDLDNLAYTLQVGREAMEERLALQVSSLVELSEKLRKYLQESQEGGDWYRGQVVRHDGISVFATDEDSQKTVTAWMKKGKYEKLLQWWVKGGTIDWKHLYGECLPRRISLPTYPFARERYWLTTSTIATRSCIEVCDDEEQVAVCMRGLSTRVLGGEEEWRTVLLTPGWKEEKSLMHQLEASPEPSTSVASNPLVLLCGLPKIEAARIQSQMASGSFCRRLRVNVGHTSLSRREQRFQEAVVQLIQQLQDVFHSRPAEPLLVQVVVGSPEEPSFLEALTGVLKTAQLEYPKLLGQLIEVEGELEEEELLVLLRENQQWPQELHIRYRDSKRWVRHWQELPLLSVPPKVPWKEGGCYLISGGAGGLGRLFVQEIVRHVQQATVILVGRSELSQELRAHLKQGGSTGLHIDYQQVDVSDGLAVHALIQRALEQYGHLDGIIHAAGVLRDSLLLNKTQKQVQEVLAPKVMGVEHLDEASREIPLDVFILCSSLSAVLGNVGQADYAAANAYLDAFAYKRQAQVLLGTCQGTTLSINWPLWEEGGMQIESGAIQMMREQAGIEVMDTETGMKTLYQALASGLAQVMVAHGQVERIKQRLQYRSPEPPGVVGQAQGAVPTFADRAPTDPDREVWQDRLCGALARMVSDLLKVRVEEIDVQTPLSEYGFDSITLTQLSNRLNQSYGLDLTPALFFEHSTLSRLAQYLQATSTAVLAPHFALTSPATSGRSQGINRVLAPEVKLNEMREAASNRASRIARWLVRSQPRAVTPIAIIGMSGAFPQAPDVQSLWSHLLAGKDCISEIPASRWDWQSYFGETEATEANKTNIKWAGVMEGIELFDPLFFGISPREAEQMDPQQRLLMMYVWKAIEDAGYSASSLSGTNTALFVGTTSSGYSEIVYRANREIDGYSSTGQASSVGPGRMSYFLNLHGPSEPIETACSSSLVAIYRGVNAIESGESSMAIVGGVNTLLSPETHISFSKAGMLSEDGRCKSFSAQANGYVRGEGVGMLVLKKLSDAEQAGDHIYAVIRGSAENHGGRASSLTAPNPRAQADLLVAAYRKAGIDPRTVGYIEAHGTGTPLGDPVEINALKTAWSELRTGAKPYNGEEKSIPQAWCGIGSVKSNIGHLELAAGVAGVIKVVLQLQHRQLVKSLHCEQLNPYIQLEESPFYIVQENREWEVLRDDKGSALPRRAGISSFGFGGVNAHVVLEEYVPKAQENVAGSAALPDAIIVLSARTEERLQEQVRQLLNWMQAARFPEEPLRQAQDRREARSLQDLAYTLQVGREAMEERLAFQVSSLEELSEKLGRYLQDPQGDGGWYRGQVRRHEAIGVFTADEDGQKAVIAWISKEKYGKLLDLWVKGLTINWEHLYKQERPRRISLPTYPFAHERYWISRGVSGDVDGGKPDPYGWSPTSLTILHPLVQCNISDFFEQRFSSTFDGEEFFLTDHVISGQRVMPGVIYIEMARAAIAQAMRSAVWEEEHILHLSQIVWIRPLVIGKQPVEVHITLELQESQQAVFTISNQTQKTEGETQDIVCQGRAELDVEEEVAQSLDLAAIQTRCQRFTLSAKECYQRFSELSMSYGPAMQGLEQLSIGEGEVLARLHLPVVAQTSTEGCCLLPYVLHPSVLDAALQACIGLQADLNAYQNPQARLSAIGLPFALDEFSVVGDVPTQGWSWVRLHPGHVGQVFDIDVCDDAGRIAVRLRGLSIRQIPASAEESQTVLSPESATEEVGETYV